MLPIRTEYRATGHVKTGDRQTQRERERDVFNTTVEGSEEHGTSERHLEGDKRV